MTGISRKGTVHSGHDVAFLLEEWRELADVRGWAVNDIARAGDFPVFAIETSAPDSPDSEAIYVSAGVHGDECAPPWALLEWAESLESGVQATIFPCLNPVGLAENTRFDGNGVDLNRRFQDRSVPVIAAWQEYLEGRKFRAAANLHEDYDAAGIYLYELPRSESCGDALLAACEAILPREISASVDGSDFENGLLQRSVDPEELRRVVEEDLEGGWPEAIWLYLHHAHDSFTFETPSEAALLPRIAAHRRFLETIAAMHR